MMKQLHLIPDYNAIEDTLKQAEKWNAAFEYNDFFDPNFMDDIEQVKKRILFYKGLNRDRKQDTIHGAFFDLSINSPDKKIAEISCMRMRQSMETAAELGVKAVIFHTNIIAGFLTQSYLDKWVACNAEYIAKLLDEYQGICIYMENMFDQTPDCLKELAKQLNCSDFGICYDVAHGNLGRSTMEEWFEKLSPYIRHIHMNDNFGKLDQHLAVGEGTINWKKFSELMKVCQADASVLVEVSSLQSKELSLQYMKENHIYPFN